MGKKTESRGRFQVYDGDSDDEGDGAQSARSDARRGGHAGGDATSPVHVSGMLRLASAPSLSAAQAAGLASPTTPREGSTLSAGGAGGGDAASGRKMRMGRFVVASEGELPEKGPAATAAARKKPPLAGATAGHHQPGGGGGSALESAVPQLQQALLQANRQQESLQRLLASLAVSGGAGGASGGAESHGEEHGKDVLSRASSGSSFGQDGAGAPHHAPPVQEKPVPKPERSIAAKAGEHACVKAAGDLERRVRLLAEENEKLKRRNMQLERDLNKYYNLYLEAEEDREEHREEEEELRVEKEATARVEAKEKEHKLGRGTRATQSSGNLLAGANGAKLDRKTTPP